MWISMYASFFYLCWVEVGVGNSKGISMCKDFFGNKLAYCVCVSFSSFNLTFKSKPMEALWLQIKYYVISLIAQFESCFVGSSIFHVRFPCLLGITLNPKICYSWSNPLNLYSLPKFKIKHVCFLLELHCLFT
jgi:hypothetical protein